MNSTDHTDAGHPGRDPSTERVASDHGPDGVVGIVGAGPVGLTLALRLAGFGVRSVILEAEPTLRRQGSKACLIQGDVLEVLDKVDSAGQVAAEGVAWHIARTYVRGREIRRTTYPHPLGYGPFVNISQYRIEQVLADRVAATDTCEIRWSHRVTGVEQDRDGVSVQVETAAGLRQLRFSYLAACDGVRSRVRELTGVRWTGYRHGDQFLITDIRADLPFAKERHFHYDPPFNPGRQVVMHPQPDSVWRIDWQLAPDADIEAERRTGELDRRIRAVIGDRPYEIDWLSTYRFHQQVVDRFVVGRILFAGDAAHALPPYGARGMNSGIQDADNLAWKLALVLTGVSGPNLLETYHDERYAAALENLRVTEATIRFMVPPTSARRWVRSALLRSVHHLKSLRRHVNSGQMAEPYVYRESPIVDRRDSDPLLGRFAPDAPVLSNGRRVRLRQMFGHRFVGLIVGHDPGQAAEIAAAASRIDWPIPAELVAVLPTSSSDTGQLAPVGASALTGLATVIHADGPELGAAYPAGWYLVRPDSHIAAVGDAAAAAGFADALARCAAAALTDRTSHGSPVC